jgi:hypothetical protein
LPSLYWLRVPRGRAPAVFIEAGVSTLAYGVPQRTKVLLALFN